MFFNNNTVFLALTGKDSTSGDAIAKIYQYKDNSFTLVTDLPGIHHTNPDNNIGWADYDNDGDLDLLITGLTQENLPVTTIYEYSLDENDNIQFQPGVTPFFDATIPSNDENLIFGWEDNDQIWGGSGNDIIKGGEGDDRIQAGTGTDLIDGGEGSDRIDGGKDIDVLTERSMQLKAPSL